MDRLLILADDLAQDVIEATEVLGDDTLIEHINKMLEASSSTMQEAYMSSVRARRAETRARAFLEARLRKAAAELEAQVKGGGDAPL